MSNFVFNDPKVQKFFKAYPHIKERLTPLWGSRPARYYLYTLLTDSRHGKRKGFPLSDVNIVLDLLENHDRYFPQYMPGEPAIHDKSK